MVSGEYRTVCFDECDEDVVLSGGEATLYDDLPQLCRQIKTLGFKIKLDTNGLQTDMIEVLVQEKLVD